MTFHLRRSVGTLAAVAFLALVQPPSQAVAQQASSDAEIRRLVAGLQDGSLDPAYVSGECQRQAEESEEREGLREVMSTFLAVPESQALTAFCDALVDAVKAGDLNGDTLVSLPRMDDDETLLLELGRVLRAVYFSHRITLTGAGEASQ